MDRFLINPDGASWEKAEQSLSSEEHFKQGYFKSS